MVPSRFFWLIPALCLGIVSSSMPLHYLYKALLRERYESYTMYINRKMGYGGWWVLRKLSILTARASSLVILFGVDCYTAFTQKEIVINRFWTFCRETYPYSAIREIRRVTKPNKRCHRDDLHYSIEFGNGAVWKTTDGAGDSIPESDAEVMNFVSEKVAKPINEEFHF